MRTPRQRVREMQRARVMLSATPQRHETLPPPRPLGPQLVCLVAPAPFDNDEWGSTAYDRRRGLWWQVSRAERRGGEICEVLIAQVRAEETMLKIVASQKWQTRGRKFGVREIHHNWRPVKDVA